jgi:ATP-dependent RNA helicase RhlB
MPVQEQVLAHAFSGHDLYVQSQTGTGKTAAFLVVIFQRLLTEPLLGGKKALIMVPTRELAVQVEEEAKVIGEFLPFKIGSFYGGVGYAAQQKLLRDNADILVGTPGRVLDLNSSGQMNLMDIAFLVIDEADRMFDMGFYPDLRKLIRVVPPIDRRQTMLFSATLNAWVKNLAWEYTKDPVEIEIEPETVTVDEVDQVLYHVPSADKMRLLLGLLDKEKPESAIIFCNTKRYTEIVAKRLRLNGWDCEFIIGDLQQSKRLKIIEDIKAGRINFLAATDVAARGLDIEGLAMVVNYDLPEEAENYVHRIGRTARAGKTGKAISLASEQDVYELPAIERYIGKPIPSVVSTEEMYGEDKSAGRRIESDFYDDRRSDRRDRPGRRDSGGRSDRGGRSGGERGYGGERRERGGEGRRRDDRYDSRREPERGAERREPERGAQRRRDGERRGSERDREQRGGAERGAERGAQRRRDERGAQPRDGEWREDRVERPEKLSSLSFEERMAYYKRKYEPPEGEKRRDSRRGGKDGRRSPDPRSPGSRPSTPDSRLPTSGNKVAADSPKKGLLSRLKSLFTRSPKE